MLPASEFSFEALEPIVAPVESAPAAPAVTPADVLAQAQAEAEQLRAAARAQGYADGRAEGLSEALAISTAASSALAAALEASRAETLALAERLEGDAVELALLLAEKVVAGALDVRPELVLEAVRHALRGVVERERITVLVNPDDLALVSESMAAVQAELGGIDHWEVQAERRVARGGAVVRHAHGDVDAQLDAKFLRAREVVEAALSEDA
jgi:flagellar biosynthesis/type III secretory pathway protein FliH